MCMGFGCNACGVVGCRIIDSPRERLIAMLTNSFAPCNGRFPLLIFLCSVFFAGSAAGGSLLLTTVIAGSVLLTLAASRLLSATILKGVPSSFTLELPPYRTPQIGRVILRSVFDRTLFVLGRAAAVAAPCLLYTSGPAWARPSERLSAGDRRILRRQIRKGNQRKKRG